MQALYKLPLDEELKLNYALAEKYHMRKQEKDQRRCRRRRDRLFKDAEAAITRASKCHRRYALVGFYGRRTDDEFLSYDFGDQAAELLAQQRVGARVIVCADYSCRKPPKAWPEPLNWCYQKRRFPRYLLITY